MITVQTDPRTEQVAHAADNVEHIYCPYEPDVLLCGAPAELEIECPNGFECNEHDPCPICATLWETHVCKEDR
jgi:hypothetical protein